MWQAEQVTLETAEAPYSLSEGIYKGSLEKMSSVYKHVH